MTKQLARVGWALVILLAFTLLLTSAANAASRTISIGCGQDIDNVINGDPSGTSTRFVLQPDCTFTPSETMVPRQGDEVICGIAATSTPQQIANTGFFAYDPHTRCTVSAAPTLAVSFKPQGLIYMESIRITGGDFKGVAGTGVGIQAGQVDPQSLFWAMEIMNNEAAGVSNAHGIWLRSEFTNNTTNSAALGYIGSAMKGTEEFVVEQSYIHDTQGNGIWCDEECNDTTNNVFHVNYNVVVGAGREGIRWEKVGAEATHGEALIEHNEVHGNGAIESRAGIGARDSQDALIRENFFGAKSVFGSSYAINSGGAIRASDSGRTDRPDLFTINIVNNQLSGEVLKGCELPDNIVFCSGNIP